MSFDLFDRKRLIERGDETLRVGRARSPAQHFAQRAVNYLSELRRTRRDGRAWRSRTRRAPRTDFFGQDCETLYFFQQFFLGHRFTPSNLVALSACLTRGSRSVPLFRPIVFNKRELFQFWRRRRRFGVRDHPFRYHLPALKERLLGFEQLPLAAVQRLPDQVGPRLPFAATFTPEADDVVNRRVTNHLGKEPQLELIDAGLACGQGGQGSPVTTPVRRLRDDLLRFDGGRQRFFGVAERVFDRFAQLIHQLDYAVQRLILGHRDLQFAQHVALLSALRRQMMERGFNRHRRLLASPPRQFAVKVFGDNARPRQPVIERKSRSADQKSFRHHARVVPGGQTASGFFDHLLLFLPELYDFAQSLIAQFLVRLIADCVHHHLDC